MKILELSFKNLNSLYGEWKLDFTAPEFEGIFALTGPTGAGKSTILDAICLALYGATPRLGKITQSGNEIMSRRTGECYAELVFQSREAAFRCRWDQRRSRKKADGALQAPEHQIAEAESGKILESKRSRVVGVIEEKTGMDFERFTRSVLLAQGSFDSFLKADAEKKSSILEQITGTAVYTEISKLVHERQREEKERLTLLEAEITGIPLLDREEEEALRTELEAALEDDSARAAELEKISEAVAWLKGISGLQDELKALDDELLRLQNESEAFAPEKKRLEDAEKASSFEAEYAAIETERRQIKNDSLSLEEIRKSMPSLESAFRKQSKILQEVESELQKGKKERQQSAPLIRQARALDQSISELGRNILSKEESRKKLSREYKEQSSLRQQEENKLLMKNKEARISAEYLKDHSRDEALVSSLAGIEEQLATLLSLQSEVERRKEELSEGEKELKRAGETLLLRQKELEQSQLGEKRSAGELEKEKKVLEKILEGRLLREYRAKKDSLQKEISLRDRIASLEEQRAALVDGQACPLCGATHHPYAQEALPLSGELEKEIEAVGIRIVRAEKQEELIRQTEENLRLKTESLKSFELKVLTAEQEIKSAAKALDTLKKACEKALSEYDLKKQNIAEALESLGISGFSEQEIPSLLPSLKKRLNTWMEHSRRTADIDKEINALEGELKRLDGILELHKQSGDSLDEELKTLNIQRMTLQKDRWDLFEEKDPDAEEQRLNILISDAEKKEKQERHTLEGLQRNLQGARTEESSLCERINAQQAGLEELEETFSEKIKQKGIKDEDEFLCRRLPPEQLEKLTTRARELEDRNTRIHARRLDRREKLTGEALKELTPHTLEQLEPELRSREEDLKTVRENGAALRHKLASHKEAEQTLREKRTVLEGQKKECRRWDKLHVLIGSADGKKYRNFAQGLTFELMVSHANRQLQKMSDRYLLLRDDEDPLALNVLDNYQAGEIRSVKNLSGGESFIISLSLALGLSRMASRRVQVDSLFLDEGFGTLDEEALETALETLAGLHQDGKTIGIISHVAALKERIATRIAVNPQSGGKSILSGPGCSRIMD